MKTLLSAFALCCLFQAFAVGEAFADTGKNAAKAGTGKEEEIRDSVEVGTGSGASDESEDKVREKQKAIDDVNAFLIESYKIKLDKLLDDVYRSVRVASKDDPALQTLLLKRVLSEIGAKMDSISDRDISPNRKKILLAVFSYLRSDIESKIRALGEK